MVSYDDLFVSNFGSLSSDEKVDFVRDNIKTIYYSASKEVVAWLLSFINESDLSSSDLWLIKQAILGVEYCNSVGDDSIYLDFFLRGMSPEVLCDYRLTDGFCNSFYTNKSVSFFKINKVLNGEHYSFNSSDLNSIGFFQASIDGDTFVCRRKKLGLSVFFSCKVNAGLDLTINDSDGSPLVWTDKKRTIVDCDSEAIFLSGVSLFVKSNRYPIGVYGHLILDWIPEIVYFLDKGVSFNRLMIPDDSPDFVFNIIDCFIGDLGVKIFRYDSDAVYHCEEALFSTSYEITCHPMNFMDPALMKVFFRYIDKIKEERSEEASSYPKKLYLSRKGDSCRGVANESELVKKLEAEDFFIPNLIEMEFSEQIAMFSNAEVIIAAHGSALSNIIFCKEGTKVLEFLPKAYATNCFALISSSLRLHYDALLEDLTVHDGEMARYGTLKTTSMNPSTLMLQQDYCIDVSAVETWLQSINI